MEMYSVGEEREKHITAFPSSSAEMALKKVRTVEPRSALPDCTREGLPLVGQLPVLTWYQRARTRELPIWWQAQSEPARQTQLQKRASNVSGRVEVPSCGGSSGGE